MSSRVGTYDAGELGGGVELGGPMAHCIVEGWSWVDPWRIKHSHRAGADLSR